MGENLEVYKAKLLELIDPSVKDSVSEQLECKIDITQVLIRERITSLHIAASKNDTGLVKFLLEHVKTHLTESDSSNFIDAQDNEGNTALHFAAINGSIDHVKALLHAGAIYKIENREGLTPWDLAGNQTTRSFLEFTDKFFKCAKRDKIKFKMLKELDNEELLVMMNARDTKGRTIRQVDVSLFKAIVSFLSEKLEIIRIIHPIARMITR